MLSDTMSSSDGASHTQDLAARRLEILLGAALALAGEHDVDRMLPLVVKSAAAVAGARYAALGIYDEAGGMDRFIHHGVDDGTVAMIGALPEGRGLLGKVIVADGPVRLDDLAADPRSLGFPPHHPPMRRFLGVPVRRGARRFGNLYLTEKEGGAPFDEEDERLVVILAAFAAAAMEGALLVVAERERSAARGELAAARERERLGQEMLMAVFDAQEAERARVARDLHDQIGQDLTSVLLALRLVETSLDRGGSDLGDARLRTAEARELVNDALRDARQLAFDLRPTVLDDVGLVAALRRLTGDLAARHDLNVVMTVDGLDEDRRFPGDVETVVYRVVQEALTNVIRHAGAGRAQIRLAHEGTWVRAVVTDDGAGFDPRAAVGRSLGLLGMQERAALVRGRVEVVSSPGTGTAVQLEVPLVEPISSIAQPRR
jgi:signal transduction histidine kinase